MIVLFDFDGVVMDTEPQYTAFWDKRGMEYFGVEDFAAVIKGQTLVQIFDKHFKGRDEDQKVLTAMVDDLERNMVYDYLPFMIYPIYNILNKMDKSYMEAAADLGATPWQVFWKVQVPLSMPGIISGVMMVFMPTVSTFAISEFLTNNKIKLFGTIIQENINSSMWNYGAALSLVMLVIIGITSLLQDNKKEDVSGGIV